MPQYGINVTVPATESPVSVDDLKTHMNIIGRDASDDYLQTLIDQANDMFELDTYVSVCTKTWTMVLDRFPYYVANRILPFDYRGSALVLPRDPVQSVVSVQYYDQDNTLQTVADFQLSNQQKPSRILAGQGQFWPFANVYGVDTVVITFIAGYAAVDVPPMWKRAIMLLAAHFYENREASADKQIYELPLAYKRICRGAKVHGFVF